MKTILDTIVEHKKMEVLKRKGRKAIHLLEEKPNYHRKPLDPLQGFMSGKPEIIAEFKRRSPSKGIISEIISSAKVVKAYQLGGAVASSVLTDRDFFGGSFKDLENARAGVEEFPLLRKDFMIDPYQIHEAKAYGADIILLIASILDKNQISHLTEVAKSLGLTVLLEVHSEEEIDKWNPGIAMIGVNNRDLKDFTVDIQRSVALFEKLPQETIKISESGLQFPTDVKLLFDIGYHGFLMGESFMKTPDPGQALVGFIEELNTI